MTTPGLFIESGQLVAFRRGRRGGIGVSLFFMMMGEVIEVLNCGGIYVVKVDSIFIGDGEVL